MKKAIQQRPLQKKIQDYLQQREKMTVVEKEKTIEIDGTDDQEANNDQHTGDEATIIVNETLVEIHKEKVLTREQIGRAHV